MPSGMTGATSGGGAKTPEIEWRTGASVETARRVESDLAELTSLDRVVRDRLGFDPHHQAAAFLKTEHPVQIGSAAATAFTGYEIAGLADLRRSDRRSEP